MRICCCLSFCSKDATERTQHTTLTSFNVTRGSVWLCGHQHKARTYAYIKHTVWLAPSSPELLKRRGVLPGEAKLSAGEGEESKGAAESTHFASARLFHGVFLSIKSVTFSQSHQRKAAFHCISRQTVCTVINCFPRCDVLCTLVILCCWEFFFPFLWSKQNSLFRPRNQPPDTVNKKMSISCC